MSTSWPSPAPLELLVCSDGSPASEGAFRAALGLARNWPCRLRLFQVLEYNPGFACLALDSLPQWEQEARQGLERQRAHAQALGVEAEILVSQGQAAADAILAEAARQRPDLIVMGRRGQTDAKTVFMGSVTARLIGESTVPILVAPRQGPFTFSRFLVAHDGSPFSEAAWQEALLLARRRPVRLLVVSVAQKEKDFPELENLLNRLQEEAEGQNLETSTFLVQGLPAEALIRAALLLEADLIVMGSYGRTGLSRWFMGSVAEQVIGEASCPILVVTKGACLVPA